MAGTAERGREAFARRAWGEAHALFDGAGGLDVDDLERSAVAAHLAGRDGASAHAWERAHRVCLDVGDLDRAVRCAFWLGFGLLLRGEAAQAGGWLARAERVAGQPGCDGAGSGLLLVPQFLVALDGGDHDRAFELAERAVALAQRFDDRDLLALGVLCLGEACLAAGQCERGRRLLDEAMVSATAADVSPITTGIVYCAVLEACMSVCDLGRAREWTGAMTRWCAAQPDLVAYRGQCLVHRSQVLQATGDWPDAALEAERARRRLAEPAHPALGLALYQQGELHRLRGELADAERAYREAGEHGREPAPGFALLRLAQGSIDAATAAVGRMVEENRDLLTRPAVLAAAVEIRLAAGEHEAARDASDELALLAGTVGTPALRCDADHAGGSVALARGSAPAALPALRRACAGRLELGMPYDVARTRELIALACRALGDHETAAFELDAARSTFERLGARPDLDRLTVLDRPAPTSVLTVRECQVLRLVAAGRTNREVATELVISEHTVSRHLQNIFGKIGVPSRAAATAYAFRHGLVPGASTSGEN